MSAPSLSTRPNTAPSHTKLLIVIVYEIQTVGTGTDQSVKVKMAFALRLKYGVKSFLPEWQMAMVNLPKKQLSDKEVAFRVSPK